MKPAEIIKHINDGAIFYLKFFGDAEHMEYHNNGVYSYIKPRDGEQGISFAFDIHLEGLPKDEQIKWIDDIKGLGMPVWWDLRSSAGLFKLIHDREKEAVHGEPQDGDELYMAMFPDELKRTNIANGVQIKKIDNSEDFAVWANLQNEVLCGSYRDIHPENHYKWCGKGLIDCYICFKENVAVAFSAVMNQNGICSLEFVGTHPDCRKQGFAKAVCFTALKNAFENGAKIITLRAMNPGTKELYTGLGFRIYNFAL